VDATAYPVTRGIKIEKAPAASRTLLLPTGFDLPP